LPLQPAKAAPCVLALLGFRSPDYDQPRDHER
jgi:hypothetical protein